MDPSDCYWLIIVSLISALLVSVSDQCKCFDERGEKSMSGEGCVITEPAMIGYLCHCYINGMDKYFGAGISHIQIWNTCEGTDVPCNKNDIPGICAANPDKTLSSCLKGRGVCDGYIDKCSCTLTNEGCRIEKSTPVSNTSCHCDQSKKCKGTISLCRDYNKKECISPDNSKASCLQGGGNCGGYPEECECNYFNNGCKIVKIAEKNKACKCQLYGETYCVGYNVPCIDPANEKCQHPDNSKEACLQGGGNCGGYPDDCECDYVEGGCAIIQIAKPNTACKCQLYGIHTCHGNNAPCKDSNHIKCKYPDNTKEACEQGGGNCDGSQPKDDHGVRTTDCKYALAKATIVGTGMEKIRTVKNNPGRGMKTA